MNATDVERGMMFRYPKHGDDVTLRVVSVRDLGGLLWCVCERRYKSTALKDRLELAAHEIASAFNTGLLERVS